MIDGMHLTPIGSRTVLREPRDGMDPGDPEAYAEPLLQYLQQSQARRLIYDLKNVPVIDELYYAWLVRVSALCQIAGIELVTANMRPAAAYALALMLTAPPPFTCALDVDSARGVARR